LGFIPTSSRSFAPRTRRITALTDAARRIGVSSTPTFLIGRQDGDELLLTRRRAGPACRPHDDRP